jgi:hypothetical protein
VPVRGIRFQSEAHDIHNAGAVSVRLQAECPYPGTPRTQGPGKRRRPPRGHPHVDGARSEIQEGAQQLGVCLIQLASANPALGQAKDGLCVVQDLVERGPLGGG